MLGRELKFAEIDGERTSFKKNQKAKPPLDIRNQNKMVGTQAVSDEK